MANMSLINRFRYQLIKNKQIFLWFKNIAKQRANGDFKTNSLIIQRICLRQ